MARTVLVNDRMQKGYRYALLAPMGKRFDARNPRLALLDITFMWLAIVATIATFAGLSPLAAWLLAPYLLWVSFAAHLNWAIVRRN